MQATTMTNISEKSIVMDSLFFLGWYFCWAPGTDANADADAMLIYGYSRMRVRCR